MYLSDFDLQQLDEQKLTALPAEQKDALLVKLLWDLKDARERLKRGKGLNGYGSTGYVLVKLEAFKSATPRP